MRRQIRVYLHPPFSLFSFCPSPSFLPRSFPFVLLWRRVNYGLKTPFHFCPFLFFRTHLLFIVGYPPNIWPNNKMRRVKDMSFKNLQKLIKLVKISISDKLSHAFHTLLNITTFFYNLLLNIKHNLLFNEVPNSI